MSWIYLSRGPAHSFPVSGMGWNQNRGQPTCDMSIFTMRPKSTHTPFPRWLVVSLAVVFPPFHSDGNAALSVGRDDNLALVDLATALAYFFGFKERASRT